MDSKTKEAITNVLKSVGATEDEEILINYSNTSNTKEMNHSRVISEFLLAKQLKEATEKFLNLINC